MKPFLLLLLVPVAAAAQATDLTGTWQGSIRLPGTPLAVTVELAREGEAWSGTIDIPAQNASDLPLTGIRVTADSAVFTIEGVPGEPTFRGAHAPGRAIEGTFHQGGQAFPFVLSRGGGADEARVALEGLDAWIDARRADWNVPGLALAIVKDDQVVHLGGYGLRNVADSLPVTTGTLFAIGSSTKAFTAALLGALVDEGRIDWDDRAAAYLPELVLQDTTATQRLTIRDLITHRSGLPRHDALWYLNPDLERPELVERLAYLPPTRDLRASFQYNNLMFLAAGYLAGRVAGSSWEDAVRARLLGPLGMDRSNFSVATSQGDPDFALPYGEREDTLLLVPFRTIDAVGPAGSINSSAEEMTRWVRMHLAEGELEGRRILQQATVEAMQTPAMFMAARPSDPAIGVQAYGLGWFLDSYRGHFRVHHGGNIDGFSALVVLYPHDELGIVVLTNRNGTPLPEITARQVADRVFDLEPRDWSGELLARRNAQREAEADSVAAARANRVEGTRPSHGLDAYAGSYRHPGYGQLDIAVADGGLRVSYGDERLDLDHVHFDVFETVDPEGDSPFAGIRMRFRTALDGGIEAAEIALEPSLPAASFARAPEARLTDQAFLDRLTGLYRFQGQTVTVARRGDTLAVTVPGQPTYRLVPVRETSFALGEAPQIRVSFDVPAEGPAEALTFHQPNGTFRYQRVEDGGGADR